MTLAKAVGKSGYFMTYILNRIAANKNFICAITGPTGGGKSWSGLRLGEELDDEFNIDNVCFMPNDFMDLINLKVKILKKGSVILWDEFQVAMSHLEFQSQQAKLLNYLLQTFRHRNFILIITTPHFNMLNATARKLFHCRMETMSIDQNTKQCTLKPLLLQVNQYKGDIYQKYLRIWHPSYGVVPLKTLKVGMPSQELIDAYEKKKNAFTSQLNINISRDLNKAGDVKAPIKRFTEQQSQILDLLRQGKKVIDISAVIKVSRQAIYNQMALIRKKGVEINPKKEKKTVKTYEILGF